LFSREKNLSPVGGNTHKLIIDTFLAGNKSDKKIASRLRSLKSQRVDADYNTGLKISQKESDLALERAKQVLLDLGVIDKNDIGFTIPML